MVTWNIAAAYSGVYQSVVEGDVLSFMIYIIL